MSYSDRVFICDKCYLPIGNIHDYVYYGRENYCRCGEEENNMPKRVSYISKESIDAIKKVRDEYMEKITSINEQIKVIQQRIAIQLSVIDKYILERTSTEEAIKLIEEDLKSFKDI